MHLLLVFLLLATSLHAATLTGTVVAVEDGDTVTLLDSTKTQHKIRLLGIDAPEKAQPFGRKSKFSLSELVYLKEVTIDYEKQDRYGRTLGKVRVDGHDANLTQVERGMAWWYRAYKHDQTDVDRKLYEEAEDASKASKVGLWADKQPVPPWEFRKDKK